MSGHSKWHSIKHQKAAADAKKGAIFTKMARNITMAVKKGGPDPETNFSLRVAIDQAKSVNVPKDNIERAIKRGSGEDNEAQLQETMFEGYAPGGVAILIQTVTDNNNRTVSDVRHTLSKHGGSLGESGSVMWNFEQKGVIRIENEHITGDTDAFELEAIEAGADDIQEEGGVTMITTEPKNLQTLREKVATLVSDIDYSGVEFIAKNTVEVDDEQHKKLENLTDALDELDDVTEFYTNAI